MLKIRVSQIGDVVIPPECPVYIVDGRELRNTVDIDFTEAGNYLRYSYIREPEFWIGSQDAIEILPNLTHELRESCYALIHKLDIQNNDEDYDEAHNYACCVEQPVRDDPASGESALQEAIDSYLAISQQAQEVTLW